MTQHQQYYCYILASKPYGTLYIGVTSDLLGRVHQHKTGLIDGFSKTHGVDKLVWFEVHQDIQQAIVREKRIKKWNRDWKIQLIETSNPLWDDLFLTLTDSAHSMGSRFRGNDNIQLMEKG